MSGYFLHMGKNVIALSLPIEYNNHIHACVLGEKKEDQLVSKNYKQTTQRQVISIVVSGKRGIAVFV